MKMMNHLLTLVFLSSVEHNVLFHTDQVEKLQKGQKSSLYDLHTYISEIWGQSVRTVFFLSFEVFAPTVFHLIIHNSEPFLLWKV